MLFDIFLCRRMWMCTKDGMTRNAHRKADGQIVEGTETPIIISGEEMMYPGDKSMGAHGWNIYNCRCTMRTVEKDGIEAEPRQTRVRNPEWEKAKAEEDKLSAKVDSLKELEQKETDLKAAKEKRLSLKENVVVNDMSYSEWKNGKNPLQILGKMLF